MTEEELDELYPRLRAPPEEPLYDVACDGDDHVYQRGLQIAEALQEDTEENGRRRHAAESSQAAPLRQHEGRLLGSGGGNGCWGEAPVAVERQASCAAVARRHDRRRSAKGRPASAASPSTFWTSRAGS